MNDRDHSLPPRSVHTSDDRVTAALAGFLAAAPEDRAALAPALVEGMGAARLDAIVDGLQKRVGAVVRVTARPDGYLVLAERGRCRAWAHLDPEGRLDGLLLRPTSFADHLLRPPVRAAIVAAVLVPALGVLAGTLAAWWAASAPSLVGALASVAAIAILVAGFSVGRIYVGRPARAVAWAIIVAAGASTVRIPGLRAGPWSAADVLGVALLAVPSWLAGGESM
ncbi:MAG: hypothetical protein ACYCYK_04320 [Candidatus Dormibacteria bacterium]